MHIQRAWQIINIPVETSHTHTHTEQEREIGEIHSPAAARACIKRGQAARPAAAATVNIQGIKCKQIIF